MIYARDKIIIINVTMDKNGVVTETENDEIDAHIKEDNRTIVDANGKEIQGIASIIIDNGNTVKEGDKIKITERFGSEYSLKDKKFLVRSVPKIGGVSQWGIKIRI